MIVLISHALLHDLLIVKEHKKKNNSEGKVCIRFFVVDIIANVDAFPRVGELVNSKETSIGPGGKGTNQAISASFSDAKVHLITKVW